MPTRTETITAINAELRTMAERERILRERAQKLLEGAQCRNRKGDIYKISFVEVSPNGSLCVHGFKLKTNGVYGTHPFYIGHLPGVELLTG